jgi:DNA-binding SARP family transcriptional activator
MIEIRLMGGFSLEYDGSVIQGLGAPRMQSLITYLVLHRGMPVPRQHLAFLLWPDSAEDQARTNLRKLLHQLGKALPEVDRFLQLGGQEVQWVETVPLILDVQEFVNAIQAAAQSQTDEQEHLTRAVQLYQGDLLPGCYDEWLEFERERLRRQLANVFERMITVVEWKRDYQTAIAYTERLLQLDKLNESAHRHLMRLHSLAGDRAGALQAYQACAVILKKELSVEPDTETRDLYERLLSSKIDKPPSLAGGAAPRIRPLVGREREWTVMQQAWNRATEGNPHCIIISGEAGIGKTRLAEEILQWVTRQGYLSAAARCFASEGGLAYGPVVDWLRTGALHKRWVSLEPVWLTELSRVMPEIISERPDLPRPERLNAEWQRRRLFEALVRAFSPSTFPTSAVPIALFIDDLQWCDSETLAWLHYLMRSALPTKLLLVGTLRSEELVPGHALESWLEDLRSGAKLDEVELGPLSAAETQTLAENEAGHTLELDAATRLFTETEGHPLFVVESVRMASDPDPAQADLIPAWELSSQSPTVHAVIARRLALLSPAARDLAGLAATIGHSFTYPILVKASKESSEATLVRGLDELLQRRIIREHGSSIYDFSHDKIRAAAYQGLSSARRRFLHRCVAESLEALAHVSRTAGTGNELEELSGQIGSQFEKAGLAEQAIPYYQQAAEVARRVFANERALHYFQSALTLLQDSTGRITNPFLAAQIEEQVGDMLLLMTLRAEARSAFERGLNHLPTSERVGRATLVGKMGNTWRDEYHFEDSLAIYSRALATLGEPTGLEGNAEQSWRQCWIQIQIEVQNVYYWLAWIEKSEALYQEMRPVVEGFATFLQRAVFYGLMGAVRLRANRYVATGEIVTLFETAQEISIKAGISERIPADYFGYGFILLLHGDLDQAEEKISTALRLAEQRGDLSLETRCLTYLTIAQRKKRDVDQALSLAQRALVAAETAKMPEYAGAARANLAWVALRQGDRAQAREHSLAALELWNQSPGIQAAATPYYWTAIWPLMRVHLEEGDLAGAITFARQLLEPHRKGLPADLVAALTEAIDAWDANYPEVAQGGLLSSATLAETLGEF